MTPAVGHERSGRSALVSIVAPHDLVGAAQALFSEGMRLALVSGHDDGGSLRATYLFTSGPPDTRVELHVPLDTTRPQVPTLAALSFSASRFERELADLFGIEPVGHPQPRRMVLHQHWPTGWHPMRHGASNPPEMVADAGSFPFVPVEGPGVYEIPVGPVHAGLIEPGHFRFWVVGETILRMKARLWFVHKGVERLFEGKDIAAGLEIAGRISGDTAVGHALAYCQAVEDACAISVSDDAHVLRAVLLELERLYNHVADIGALCNDVGFGIAHAGALSLRERLLQLNREVTGHRLLRGAVVPGGARVHRLPRPDELAEVSHRFEELVELASSNALVMERFTGTAVLDEAHARDLGVVGVVARAAGVAFDARRSHPVVDLGERFSPARQTSGDVLARYLVRIDEVRSSLAILADLITRAADLQAVAASERAGDLHAVASSWTTATNGPSSAGVGICEGWRGVVVHRVEVDERRGLRRVKVVDPSFLNWPALSVALTDTIVPDFPLANKSFNLSYAGNDL